MALMTIKSDNKDFSWIIVKNPETGIVTKKVRQGNGYGWYSAEDTYHLYFKDGIDKDSFSQGDFEYLSKNKFGQPFAYNALITTFLRDVIKGVQKKDVKANNSITLHQVNFKGKKLFEHLQKHLAIKFEYEEVIPCVFKVTFSNKGSLHELVSCILVCCLLLSGETGSMLTKLDEDFMEKYATLIQKLNLPYYLRYMFARNYLKSKQQFDKFSGMLETDQIKLQHGDTAMQRLRFIESQIDHQLPILDVGAGQGLYALNLSKRAVHTYHAVDIDEVLMEAVAAKSKARGLDVVTYNNISEVNIEGSCDIILTEVIEHMPLDEAEELVSYIMQNFNYRNLFITTPNKEFNKHYLLEEGEFRHDDHDWEMESSEFIDWFVAKFLKFKPENGQLEYVEVGDKVDGCPTTQGFIVRNYDVKPMAVITVGCSGSGKSTYAEGLTKKGWVEINRDYHRFCNKERNWNTYKFTRQNEERVTAKWNKKLERTIEQKNNIVTSDTSLNKERALELKSRLEDAGYSVDFKVIDVEFEELLKRDHQRAGGVGYEVLMKQFIQFKQNWCGVEPYKEQEGLPYIYICDIDGTIAEKGDRSPFDYTKVSTDIPITSVVRLIDGAHMESEVLFLSGREDTGECYNDTKNWLSKHIGVENPQLFMREEGDHRKDYEVKVDMFDKYIRGKYNVRAVIDDRKQVIESCWNVLGVKTINVGNSWERF